MVLKLEIKDRKILSELDMDARQPISVIAKKVGLSRQVTEYRIKRLETAGIIKGYFPVINHFSLGFRTLRLRIILQNSNMEIEKIIINYYQKHEKIAWIVHVEGIWDLAIGFYVKDLNEELKILEELMDNFGSNIHEKHISYPCFVIHLNNKLMLNYPGKIKKWTVSDQGKIDLDDMDKKILEYISKKGNESIINISAKLGIPQRKVRNRLEFFLKKHIVLGFNVKLDLAKLGITHYKVLVNYSKCTAKTESMIFSYLEKEEHVVYITKPIGQYDLEFEIISRSTAENTKLLQKFKEKFYESIKFIQINKIPEINQLLEEDVL